MLSADYNKTKQKVTVFVLKFRTPTFSDKITCADNADPDQTAPE